MGWAFAIIYSVICFAACIAMGKAAWGIRKECKSIKQTIKESQERLARLKR
jgi:hypothetical protein